MGLGKTCGALTVGARARCRRWLVLAPTNAFSVWRDQPHIWLKREWPEADIHVYLMDQGPAQRESIWENVQPVANEPNRVDIFVCTIESFMNDWAERKKVMVPGKKKPKTVIGLKPRPNFYFPQIVVYDETKRIRSIKSLAYLVLQKFMAYYSAIEYFIPMTGTPGNQPRHFFTMLSIIAPKVFSSYWKFLSTFHHVFEGPFGLEVGEVRNQENWWRCLYHYFSVVKETDPGISDQLPQLQRIVLEIEMDKDQRKVYNDLEDEMISFVDTSGIVVASTTLGLITRLRQIMLCPRLLHDKLGVGAAIKDIADTIDPDEPQCWVIFVPFTQAIPHFEEYLRSEKFEHIHVLQGGLSAQHRDDIIARYRADGQTGPSIMLCSLLYAQAFSLEPASKCFFPGFDWDPDNNRQAEARLRRLTSDVQVPITSYYYTFSDCDTSRRVYDYVVLKQQRMNITIPDDIRKLILGGGTK